MDVLYMTLENDAACVVRPRFDAMTGDAKRLRMVRGYVTGDGDNAEYGAIWLTDVPALRDALEKTGSGQPIRSELGKAFER